MEDPLTCMVEVMGSEELAPLAIEAFEKVGAFQVPSSGIVPMNDSGSGKTFIVTVYIDSLEIMAEVRKFSFVKEVFSCPKIVPFGLPQK